MRFKYDDLRKVVLESDKNYLIKRWCYYDNIEDAINDVYRIFGRMKYKVEHEEKYNDVSFIIVVSQTKGEGAKRIKIPTKGRPKFKVCGVKTKPHIHIACFGKLAPSFAEEMCEDLNKNLYKNVEDYKNRKYKSNRLFSEDKLKGENKGADYIPYVYNQAEKIMTYGNLEFEKMRDKFFIVEDED